MISLRISLVLLAVLILLCRDYSFAQVDKDLDYKKFKDEFGKEINTGTDDSASGNSYVLHPASIPGWFSELPRSVRGSFYALGISDPGLEEEQAFEQAYLRAKAILAFLIAPNAVTLSDNYSDENSKSRQNSFQTKYISYFRIHSEIFLNDSMIEILEKDFTSFKEAVILIKAEPPKTTTEKLIAEANVYQVERQKTNAFEIEEKYHVTGKSFKSGYDSSHFEYELYALNNIYEISSKLNDTEHAFPYLNYRYTSGNNDSIAEENIHYSKMNYGIWKSFLESFVQEVYRYAQDEPVKVKQIGDDYISRTQFLSREISVAAPALKIESINCFNNRISVKLDHLN